MSASGRSIEQLVDLLETQDPVQASEAIEALAAIGLPTVEPLVSALLMANEDMDRWRGHWIIEALGTIGASAVPAVITLLEATDPTVRLGAVSVLGRVGDRRAIGPLLKAVQSDQDERVRRRAVTALGHLRAEGAVQVLIDRLDDPDPGMRSFAGDALMEVGEAAVQPLIGVLEDRESGAARRAAAAYELGKLRDLRALPPLVDVLLDSESPALVRRSAADGLGRLGSTQAIAPLLRVATRRHDEPAVRAAAIRSTGLLGDREQTFAPLLRLLKDETEHGRVRQAVAHTLCWAGGERAIDPLTSALDDRDPNVQLAAAQALEQWGDVRALRALQRLQLRAAADAPEEAAAGAVVARAIYAIKRHEGLPLTVNEDPAGRVVARYGRLVVHEPNPTVTSRSTYVLRVKDEAGDVDATFSLDPRAAHDQAEVLRALRHSLVSVGDDLARMRERQLRRHDSIHAANLHRILTHLHRRQEVLQRAVRELEAEQRPAQE